jgi:hypothetical protein
MSKIQFKLANLGFYPGGGWIDGDLGNSTSFTWNGLLDFCKRVGGIPQPSAAVAIDTISIDRNGCAIDSHIAIIHID